MRKTLVDTGHWVGAFYEKDKWNKEGKLFRKWFEKQDGNTSRIIITYGILTEVIARLIKKIGFKKTNKVLDFILTSNKIDIYDESKILKTQIYEIFKQFEGFSLVDSEILVIYRNLSCDGIFTTAKEFRQCAGVNSYMYPEV